MLVSIKPAQQDLEGIWVTYKAGVRFRVARAGNPNFLRASDRLEAPFRKQAARGKLSSEKQLEIQCQSMAEGILLDWEGLATEDGPLPYSAEMAAAVLRWETEIRDFVFEIATNQENFRRQEISETAKKSPAS